jgi:hypothetical protein
MAASKYSERTQGVNLGSYRQSQYGYPLYDRPYEQHKPAKEPTNESYIKRDTQLGGFFNRISRQKLRKETSIDSLSTSTENSLDSVILPNRISGDSSHENLDPVKMSGGDKPLPSLPISANWSESDNSIDAPSGNDRLKKHKIQNKSTRPNIRVQGFSFVSGDDRALPVVTTTPAGTGLGIFATKENQGSRRLRPPTHRANREGRVKTSCSSDTLIFHNKEICDYPTAQPKQADTAEVVKVLERGHDSQRSDITVVRHISGQRNAERGHEPRRKSSAMLRDNTGPDQSTRSSVSVERAISEPDPPNRSRHSAVNEATIAAARAVAGSERKAT